jgi:hypothetical protein
MSVDEWGIESEPEVQEEYKAPKGRSMWDVMNSSINKKIKPTLAEKQKINEFMFHKLLARFENSLELALMFTIRDIPVEYQYKIVDMLVPEAFIPFEKNKKNIEDGTIENIIKYYRCSESVAEQYASLMPEYEKQRINEKFNKGKI